MPNMPNPYQILRVTALASNDQIVRRGTELIEVEIDEERKGHIRSAVDALTTHPLEQAYHKFWEPPNTGYPDTVEQTFLARYGAAPVDRKVLNQRIRVFLEEECAARHLLERVLQAPEPPSNIDQIHPSDTPQTSIRMALDLWELFC